MKKILIILLVVLSFSTNAQRKLFGLNVNTTPPLDFRIAAGKVGSPSINMTLQNFLDFTTVNIDVYTQSQVDDLFKNYLSKTNLLDYDPTQPTHPATKGYVDSGGIIVPWASCTAGANITLTNCKASQVGKIVHVTGAWSGSDVGVGKVICTLPSSISTATIDVYAGSMTFSSNVSSTPLRLDANTRSLKMVTSSATGVTYYFSFSYPAI